jgi:hypothetical protein
MHVYPPRYVEDFLALRPSSDKAVTMRALIASFVAGPDTHHLKLLQYGPGCLKIRNDILEVYAT